MPLTVNPVSLMLWIDHLKLWDTV